MLTPDLIDRIAVKMTQLPKDDIASGVKTLLEALAQAAIKGERVEIRGFGGFTTHTLPARAARNPKTGATVSVPPRKRLHFKPGKELRERVDAAKGQ